MSPGTSGPPPDVPGRRLLRYSVTSTLVAMFLPSFSS
jgi:hypothetical protein